MFRIINKERLAKDVVRISLEAPLIAQKAQAGQFVVLIVEEKGERIPLTLADWDRRKGTITLIFQEVGFTTRRLATKKVGDVLEHVLGPLGHPTQVRNFGRVLCIGGGVGIAEIFPVSRAFKQAGNQVIGIVGARSKEQLILEKEMERVCQELYVTTDDGSYGRKGFVTDVLKEILVTRSPGHQVTSLVYASGPVAMMRAVSEITRPLKIKTIVSLNPIMVDATGMCGACRCVIAGETKFVCVDGPEFDAHQVDFRELETRLNQYKELEQKIETLLYSAQRGVP